MEHGAQTPPKWYAQWYQQQHCHHHHQQVQLENIDHKVYQVLGFYHWSTTLLDNSVDTHGLDAMLKHITECFVFEKLLWFTIYQQMCSTQGILLRLTNPSFNASSPALTAQNYSVQIIADSTSSYLWGAVCTKKKAPFINGRVYLLMRDPPYINGRHHLFKWDLIYKWDSSYINGTPHIYKWEPSVI